MAVPYNKGLINEAAAQSTGVLTPGFPLCPSQSFQPLEGELLSSGKAQKYLGWEKKGGEVQPH